LADQQERLRALASFERTKMRASTLDEKTDVLLRVGALIALGASPGSYSCSIRRALDAGATVDEIVDTLVAVSTTVGAARVVMASRGLAPALGFDIDAAIEEVDRMGELDPPMMED
jgi:alkylhydroperoxidase/carboxymuconolactone decarboxylase family protein YurZ